MRKKNHETFKNVGSITLRINTMFILIISIEIYRYFLKGIDLQHFNRIKNICEKKQVLNNVKFQLKTAARDALQKIISGLRNRLNFDTISSFYYDMIFAW